MNPALTRVVAGLLFLAFADAKAASDVQFGGAAQSDIRFRLYDVSSLAWYNRVDFPAGVSRNMNLAKFRATGHVDRVRGVVDIDFLWLGVNAQVGNFDNLFERQTIEPLRIKSHAAYAEIDDLFVAGLDLRVGQQIIAWGVGDAVNPTNVLNPPDFEDPLLFGNQLANSMIRADYALSDDWGLSVVAVPVFVPAVLNPVSVLAVTDPTRLPFAQAAVRQLILLNDALTQQLVAQPAVNSSAALNVPGLGFDNLQYAVRLAGTFFKQDVAVMFYDGRFTQPVVSRADVTQVNNRRCDPANPANCINGTFDSALTLGYPRFSMLGINAAGEVPYTGLEWHAEVGVFFPERAGVRIFEGNFIFNGFGQAATELDYNLGGKTPSVYDATTFAKWNVGLSKVLPAHVFVRAQWVHGFVDEFGDGDTSRDGSAFGNAFLCKQTSQGGQCTRENTRPRIGDYLVLDAQKSFFADRLLLGLWMIWDLTGVTQSTWDTVAAKRVSTHFGPFNADYASAIVAPSLTYAVGGGFTASVGVLAHLGKQQSKFGDPVLGAGIEAWTRLRYAF